MLLKKEMSISEIEEFLKSKGDYVKIDLLGRLLHENIPNATRKFVFLKLGEIYERSSMFADSANSYEKAAGLSFSEGEKKDLFVKASQLFVRAGDFNRAEGTMRNAVSNVKEFEKRTIYEGMKKFFIFSAEMCEKSKKLGDAVKLYERVLIMELSEQEKRQVKEKLMSLYEKLGKIREYMALKNSR